MQKCKHCGSELLTGDDVGICNSCLESMPADQLGETAKTRAIISLTTIPSRLPQIGPCLRSLAIQGFPVHLWLPKHFKRGNERLPQVLPAFLDKLGVNYTVVDDLGSITKLLPALKLKTELIVTADDDVIYGEDWARDLVEYAEAHPRVAACYRGRVFRGKQKYNDSKLLRYVERPRKIHMITGVWGAIYRPSFFDDSIYKENEKWPLGDDLVISGHLRRKGVPMHVIPMRNDVKGRYGEIFNIDSLWEINRRNNNDIGMRKVFWNKAEG